MVRDVEVVGVDNGKGKNKLAFRTPDSMDGVREKLRGYYSKLSNNRILNDSEKQEIIKGYEAGRSLIDLCDAFGKSVQGILIILEPHVTKDGLLYKEDKQKQIRGEERNVLVQDLFSMSLKAVVGKYDEPPSYFKNFLYQELDMDGQIRVERKQERADKAASPMVISSHAGGKPIVYSDDERRLIRNFLNEHPEWKTWGGLDDALLDKLRAVIRTSLYIDRPRGGLYVYINSHFKKNEKTQKKNKEGSNVRVFSFSMDDKDIQSLSEYDDFVNLWRVSEGVILFKKKKTQEALEDRRRQLEGLDSQKKAIEAEMQRLEAEAQQ